MVVLSAKTVQRASLTVARLAWKHLEGDVLFQALKAGGERRPNYLAVLVPLSLCGVDHYRREERNGK